MKTHDTHLQAKIAARNRINAEAKKFHAECIAAYTPFIGKKVLLAGDALSTKAAAARPPRNYGDGGTFTGFQVWHTHSKYVLYFTLKCSEHYKSKHPDTQFACYADQTIRVGEIKDGTLVSLYADDCDTLRSDYTEDEISKARKELEAAQTQLRTAESKLNYFGAFDA